jgi:hypothetical protein
MDNSYTGNYNLRNMRKRASGIVDMEEKVAAKRQTHTILKVKLIIHIQY